MKPRLITRLAAALTCVVALTGCTVVTPGPTVTVTTTPVNSDEPVKFGETYTWTDGWAVSVSEPVDYTPGKNARKQKAAHYLLVTVTISSPDDNGDLLPLSDLDISANCGIVLCDKVFDEVEGLNGGTDTAMIGRGDHFEIPVAFGVRRDLAEFSVTVTNEYSHGSASFVR